MAFRQNSKESVIFDLAEKYHVALTRFKGESYFHIRQNYGGKYVSLNMADMTSLVNAFPAMKKKLKEMKKAGVNEDTKKSKKRKRDESDDDDDDDED